MGFGEKGGLLRSVRSSFCAMAASFEGVVLN